MKSKNHEIPETRVSHLRDGRIVAKVGIRAKHEPLFPAVKKM
jgi:hypothetical protein